LIIDAKVMNIGEYSKLLITQLRIIIKIILLALKLQQKMNIVFLKTKEDQILIIRDKENDQPKQI
jgi:hypothetical protein